MVLDFLRPELERLGHRVITVDLPISDPGLGAADYAATVERALEDVERPILLGHSMAGLVVPVVASTGQCTRWYCSRPSSRSRG